MYQCERVRDFIIIYKKYDEGSCSGEDHRDRHPRHRMSDDQDSRRASSRGIIPRAKIKTVKMTFVIVFGKYICEKTTHNFRIVSVSRTVYFTAHNCLVAGLMMLTLQHKY